VNRLLRFGVTVSANLGQEGSSNAAVLAIEDTAVPLDI
jgi:hypothetical protein